MLALYLFSVALGKIIVTSPKILVDEFLGMHQHAELPSSLANFGNPPYGSVIVGRLYPTAKGEEKACSALTDVEYHLEDSHNVAILLVDRGDCFFV